MNVMNHIHGRPDPADKNNVPGSMGSLANHYDFFSKFWFLGKERQVRSKMLALAPVKPGDQVLEVGCGTGSLSLLAQEAAGPEGMVYGIDAAPEMAAVANQKAARQGSKAKFQPGLIQQIPFPDASFDVVLSSFMIHHLPSEEIKRQGLAEILRVLKPGGRLLIIEFKPPTRGFYKFFFGVVLGGRMTHTDNSELPAMLSEAGFTQVENGSTGFDVAMYIRGHKPDLK